MSQKKMPCLVPSRFWKKKRFNCWQGREACRLPSAFRTHLTHTCIYTYCKLRKISLFGKYFWHSKITLFMSEHVYPYKQSICSYTSLACKQSWQNKLTGEIECVTIIEWLCLFPKNVKWIYELCLWIWNQVPLLSLHAVWFSDNAEGHITNGPRGLLQKMFYGIEANLLVWWGIIWTSYFWHTTSLKISKYHLDRQTGPIFDISNTMYCLLFSRMGHKP